MRNPLRSIWQEREQLLQASYATFSHESKGRVYNEPQHAYRGPFQRDRDRVLHSAAFRRLSGKMQVFTGDMGDYHRTRLTHTQEVASIARTIGRYLRLNEDLIEALALLHDIGHPPYGHCGEDALQRCLDQHGGFSHNQFALQLVQQIETRYTGTPGLNLTYEVLAGQTHRSEKKWQTQTPSLEVQVVDAADSMAYDAHDVDDALQLGLLKLEDLRGIAFVDRCIVEQVDSSRQSVTRQVLVHAMIETQVGYLLTEAIPLLRSCEGYSSEEIQQQQLRLTLPKSIQNEREELEAFLFANVYRHPKLIAVRDKAATRLQQLFHLFIAYPNRLPIRFQTLSDQVGIHRAVGTYLAGMTDHFCEDTYLHLVEMGRDQAIDW
jgi:dGTPase